jgi:hypothetical protein
MPGEIPIREPEKQEQEKAPVILNLPENPKKFLKLADRADKFEEKQREFYDISQDSSLSQAKRDAAARATFEPYYKSHILKELIKSGKFDVSAFAQEGEQKEGFNRFAFEKAAGDIEKLIAGRQKKAKAESAKEPENVIEKEEKPDANESLRKEAERKLFLDPEAQIAKDKTERIAKGAAISPESKKTIDGFLNTNTERAYEKFALDYFGTHKNEIEAKGMAIKDVSDEYKVSAVLGILSKDQMAVEIRKEGYEDLKEDLDRISLLKLEMGQKPLSPEVPFLLLNYLNGAMEKEKSEIETLKSRTGDKAAEYQVANREKELAKLALAQRELVEKTMHENLKEKAERKFAEENPGKEDYVRVHLVGEREEGSIPGKYKTKEELINQEWDRVSDTDKTIEYRSGIEKFKNEILGKARGMQISEGAFYGLLEKGYKPYEQIKTKGWFSKKTFMPKQDGTFEKIPADKFGEFIKWHEDDYKEETKYFKSKEEKFGAEWDKMHKEQVEANIEARIKELAQSPEAVFGGIEKIYADLREKRVAEYIASHKPKEKTPEEKDKIKQEFIEEKRPTKNEKPNIDILGKLSADTSKIGKLGGLNEILDDDIPELGKYFREDLGINVSAQKLRSILSGQNHKEKYSEAFKGPKGLFDWFISILLDQPWKGVK